MKWSSLGHHRLIRPIGQGGMGEVFLAEDTKLGRQVAIKILPEHLAADQDRRERFELEARAVASLNHPNIVTIHSVEHAPSTNSSEPGVHFLTMEFVDGKPLADLIPSGGMPIDEFLRITIPLADASPSTGASRYSTSAWPSSAMNSRGTWRTCRRAS
jgi:serine/threonine-protein kinase